MADHDDKTDLSPDEQRDLFWSRLGSINSGMLGTKAALKFVPMSHNAEAEAAALWFITAAGTDLVEACEAGAQDSMHLISDEGSKLFARIEGQLALVDDQAKLDELWNPVADSWFEDGRDDPDVRLLKFTLADAEVWATPGGIGFLFQIAKSKVTGAIPDMGEHFTLSF